MSALTIALVGRPNSGKSSLYNLLTGGHAKVGNFPGITVDILESRVTLPSGTAATIADLPGFYSIVANVEAGTDESVARTFLDAKKDGNLVVVQVIDPTRLALGLRLTKELTRAGFGVVLAATHEDVLASEGHELDVRALEEGLALPVRLVSTRDARAKSTILAAVDDHLRRDGAARPTDFDPATLAAAVLRDVDANQPGRRMTQRIDAVLLHPVVGPFLFVGLMAALFALVFLAADPATKVMDFVVERARGALVSAFGKNLVTSFFADGILGGAGTVLAFMPQIVILTIALDVLEASGYLSRGAFLVDRVLRMLGLSGRSFVPLLMGHACAVPAVAATRIIRDPRERLTTILVLPLMTCSARLPTYALLLSSFFSHRSPLFRALLFVALYASGILTALLASSILRKTATRGRALPLVLEMPSYRLPQWRVVGRKAARAMMRFTRDVGTTIVGASAVLWVLLTVPMPGYRPAAGEPAIESSVAGALGHAIEPLTRPAGFDWRIDVGLIGAFGQRELMVGTLGVIFGIENAADDPAPLATRLREAKASNGLPVYTTANGLALLAFFVLACQCMSTVAAIRRETKSWRWPLLVVGYTYALGYVAAVVVFQLSRVIGTG